MHSITVVIIMEKTYRGVNASAEIKGGKSAPKLSGSVDFIQKPNGVLVVARVTGLPESSSGFFAMHIHSGDSCKGEGFPETKGHYNPGNTPHPEHAGDLPPLLSNGGTAFLAVLTDRFSVNDVIGRTVVIHAGADDFRTQPSGNSGEKIGCGVIKKAWFKNKADFCI